MTKAGYWHHALYHYKDHQHEVHASPSSHFGAQGLHCGFTIVCFDELYCAVPSDFLPGDNPDENLPVECRIVLRPENSIVK